MYKPMKAKKMNAHKNERGERAYSPIHASVESLCVLFSIPSLVYRFYFVNHIILLGYVCSVCIPWCLVYILWVLLYTEKVDVEHFRAAYNVFLRLNTALCEQ